MILPMAVQYRGQIIRKDNIRYLEKLLVLAATRGSSITSVRICKMNAVTFLRKQGNRGSDDIDLKTLCKFGAGSTPVIQRTDHTSQGVSKFAVFHPVKKFPRCGTRRFVG
jgi:hypothetical protein